MPMCCKTDMKKLTQGKDKHGLESIFFWCTLCGTVSVEEPEGEHRGIIQPRFVRQIILGHEFREFPEAV